MNWFRRLCGHIHQMRHWPKRIAFPQGTASTLISLMSSMRSIGTSLTTFLHYGSLCMTFPWASRYLTWILCIDISCRMSIKVDYVEQVSQEDYQPQ